MKATFGQIQEFIRNQGETLDSVLWINGLDEEEQEQFKTTHTEAIENGWILVVGEKRNKPYILLEGKWFLEDKEYANTDYEIFRFLKYCKPDISKI